ncbi:MAG: S24 family peptidase [Chloroherpetonaceae bacterium]
MPEQSSLTESQNKIFNFITRYVAEHKRPPSVREIQKQMKYNSTNAVAEILDALEAKGYIARRGGARSIEILQQDDFMNFGFGSPALDKVAPVPLMSVNWFAKGEKMKPISNLYLDKTFTHNRECFFVRVDDDGMEKSGIFKRDIVLVEKREPTETDKETLVAAICEEGVIVRNYRFINGRVHLIASSRSYSERVINPTEKFPEAVVVGIVLSLFRNILR